VARLARQPNTPSRGCRLMTSEQTRNAAPSPSCLGGPAGVWGRVSHGRNIESSRRERYRWGSGWSGSLLGDSIFWLESHGQVAPCPFPTASGYRTPSPLPSPSSPYTAAGTVFHRQKKEKKANIQLCSPPAGRSRSTTTARDKSIVVF